MIKSEKKLIDGYEDHEVQLEVENAEDFCKELHDIIMAYSRGNKETAVTVLRCIAILLESSSLQYQKEH